MMGFLDDARKKLTEAVDQHGGSIAKGLDQAADFADRKTGGKHSEKIRQGRQKAQDALDGLDGREDDGRNPPGESGSR
jgi:hypothetical protein